MGPQTTAHSPHEANVAIRARPGMWKSVKAEASRGAMKAVNPANNPDATITTRGRIEHGRREMRQSVPIAARNRPPIPTPPASGRPECPPTPRRDRPRQADRGSANTSPNGRPRLASSAKRLINVPKRPGTSLPSSAKPSSAARPPRTSAAISSFKATRSSRVMGFMFRGYFAQGCLGTHFGADLSQPRLTQRVFSGERSRKSVEAIEQSPQAIRAIRVAA